MSDNDKPATDQLPDRLSVDPRSPYYNEAVLRLGPPNYDGRPLP